MHTHRSSHRRSSRLISGLIAAPLVVSTLAVLPTSVAVAEDQPAPSVTYDFDGSLADGSGAGNDAEPRSGHDPAFEPGVNGEALSVTRGQNYVSLPIDVQPGESGLTSSFWYKQHESSSDGAIFSNQDWQTGDNPGMTVANGPSGAPSLYFVLNEHRSENLFDLTTGAIEELPGWNHITVVIDTDSQTKSLYRNGSLVASFDVGERVLESGNPFRLGTDGTGDIMTPYPDTWITGAFDDFAFYDAPLSAREVADAFRSVAPEGVLPEEGSITLLPSENGSASVDVERAEPGETITLTADPADGYHLGAWQAVSPANLVFSGNSFTMPESGFVQIQPRFDPDLEVPTVPEGTRTQKVLVVGVDGLAWEHIPQFHMPHLDAIQDAGLAGPSYLYAPDFAQTSSGPGYATQLSGVWPDKHGVVDNSFAGRQFDEYPDFLTRMEHLDPELSTVSTASWLDLLHNDVFSDEIDVLMPVSPSEYPGYPAADEAATVAMQEILSTQNPDVSYVYYGAPDAEGHTHGRDTHQYQTASQNTDDRIGRLIESVQSRETYADEDWLIMVAPDHGFIGYGHGGPTLDERRVFVYAVGGDVPNQVDSERDLEMVDVAATAISHMGFEIAPELDGVPIGTPSNDPFDTVKPQLQTALDATGPGAGYAGWTHETPDGWSIENDSMGSGGITEWSGWSLTTDVFWSGTNQLEDRENFVRGRDVWAVADPAAWRGAEHAGGFDSTMTSEPYDVSGRESATVSFMTQYRPADGQSAAVAVSFDGGESTEVLEMSEAIRSDRVSTEVEVPEGASEMTVSWQLTAPTGGWYWAVDDPQVELAGPAPGEPGPEVPPSEEDPATGGDDPADGAGSAPSEDSTASGDHASTSEDGVLASTGADLAGIIAAALAALGLGALLVLSVLRRRVNS